MTAEERKQDRQKELEALAEDILAREGIAGLSIERIAIESGYSRPTVYQHFCSKADALRSVILNVLAQSKSLFDRLDGEEIGGCPRERALGLFVAYEQVARFHPNVFAIAESLGNPWVRDSVPQDSLQQYEAIIAGYFSQLAGFLEASARDGALDLPSQTTVHKVAFSSIVMIYGIYSSVLKDRVSFQLAESSDPWRDARDALHAYWDGQGWRPLSRDHDYEAVHERILKKIFPEYWLRAKTAALAKEVDLPDEDE